MNDGSRLSSGDPATARVERATAREAAGWNPALVSALNILEYGCDEGDYDEEVAAVLKLAEALSDVEIYARVPHEKIAEACGVDACLACLIHGTAKEALYGR
jgi:hypothetical protein